ncbi:MAG: hypothetical protein AAB970_01220 [Patescibacteria group bacterium]
MTTDDDKKVSIAIPGEWALKKVLGPVLGEIGEDLQKLYAFGRDKITQAAIRKIKNPEDGAKANLRVARDVFWNGSFTDESICAEYFGGILAASRSVDGKDDTGVFYVDIIKSLSSGQLKIHYILYRTLNKQLMADDGKKNLNPGQESEIQGLQLFIPLIGVIEQLGKEDIGAILHGLHSKNLIGNFQTDNHELETGVSVPNLKVSPTALGIQLFAIANNMFSNWRQYSTVDFGDFKDIVLPKIYGNSFNQLLEKAGLKETTPDPSV